MLKALTPMKETYVFEGTEVVKTGRVAEREIKSVGGKAPRKLILVEITPSDGLDWKKWVDPALLFSIHPADK